MVTVISDFSIQTCIQAESFPPPSTVYNMTILGVRHPRFESKYHRHLLLPFICLQVLYYLFYDIVFLHYTLIYLYAAHDFFDILPYFLQHISLISFLYKERENPCIFIYLLLWILISPPFYLGIVICRIVICHTEFLTYVTRLYLGL